MKKNILILLTFFLLLSLIIIKDAMASDKYVVVNFSSTGIAVKGQSMTDLAYGIFNTKRIDKKNELTEYELSECAEAIQSTFKEIEKYNSYDYKNNGIYSLGAGYGRIICMKKSEAEKYFNKNKTINMNFELFEKEHKDDFAFKLKEEDFDKYTILPFEKDEKLAREYSDKLNTLMNTTYKTSFDCSLKNLSDRENLICHNKELADKDIELNALYKKVISRYKGTEYLQKIKSSQQKWIREYLRHVDDILDSYKDRIKYLKCLIEKDFNECKY